MNLVELIEFIIEHPPVRGDKFNYELLNVLWSVNVSSRYEKDGWYDAQKLRDDFESLGVPYGASLMIGTLIHELFGKLSWQRGEIERLQKESRANLDRYLSEAE